MNKKYIYAGFATICISFLILITTFFIKDNPINLVYMSDAKYLRYVMVSLHSAIENKHEDTIYNVHIIAKDFNNSDKEKIRKMASDNVKINIIDAKELNLNFANLGRFASFKIALQKLFIADYLKDLEKVLYLDADTLVQQDLSVVYNTPLGNNYAGAVKDGLMFEFPDYINSINLKNKKFYFNSGVMILNLNKIREDEIMQKSAIYLNTHQEVFGDQDILNVVFQGKVTHLSYKYNCNSKFFEERSAQFLSDFYGETVPQTTREVYDNATILHFSGHKPWTQWYTHTYLKPLWYQYADEMQSKYQITF